MEKIRIAIIGGGASGLMLANALDNTKGTVVFERGERLGRKLSATGNGQGNLTNLGVVGAEYFSVCKNPQPHIQKAISVYDDKSMREFFRARSFIGAFHFSILIQKIALTAPTKIKLYISFLGTG